MKWKYINQPSVVQLISSEMARQQLIQRTELLHQLNAIKFLFRQCIAIREHCEKKGICPNYYLLGRRTAMLLTIGLMLGSICHMT